MPFSAARVLRAPARARFLPPFLRAGYALIGKRIWTLFKKTARADVPAAGVMALQPWDFLDARLFFFGVWEPAITRMMQNQLQPGAVAVDVGANVGYYTLLMSRSVGPAGTVYAVEPAPSIRQRLEANIALNHAANIRVIPYGISDRRERRAFHLAAGNSGGSHFLDVAVPEADGLELRRLDDIIAPDDLARVRLIKIDVEGMEDVVLSSVFELLPRLPHALAIFVEVRVSAEMTALLDRFRAAGFRMVALENDYKMWRYADGKVGPPRNVDTLPPGQHDIVLLRGDPQPL